MRKKNIGMNSYRYWTWKRFQWYPIEHATTFFLRFPDKNQLNLYISTIVYQYNWYISYIYDLIYIYIYIVFRLWRNMHQVGFGRKREVFSRKKIHAEPPFPCDYIINGNCKRIITSTAESKRVFFCFLNHKLRTKNED